MKKYHFAGALLVLVGSVVSTQSAVADTAIISNASPTVIGATVTDLLSDQNEEATVVNAGSYQLSYGDFQNKPKPNVSLIDYGSWCGNWCPWG
jgi:hypothetical protein